VVEHLPDEFLFPGTHLYIDVRRVLLVKIDFRVDVQRAQSVILTQTETIIHDAEIQADVVQDAIIFFDANFHYSFTSS